MTESRWFAGLAAAVAAAGWAVALATGPLIAESAGGLGGLIYAAGSLICHQRSERSFHLGAAQLPVCARCLGLYAGGAIGLLTWTLVSRARRFRWPHRSAVGVLLVSGVPTAVTVASAWLGLGDPANAWRAALAVPLGIAGGLLVGAVTTDHLK
jgi:uncharacterized membrane protein